MDRTESTATAPSISAAAESKTLAHYRSPAADFLSSIQIVVLDGGAEMLQMQNHRHVHHVIKQLNLRPHNRESIDWSNVGGLYLNNLHRYTRQTILLSRFMASSLSAIFLSPQLAPNCRGRLLYRGVYSGCFNQLQLSSSRQMLMQRVDRSSLNSSTTNSDGDIRFQYFVDVVLKRIHHLISGSDSEGHVLCVVPSYLDFVRVRNHCHRTHLSFAACHEYINGGALTRARARFFHGQTKLMLVTERFYYYRRYQLRGSRHLIFYSLPLHAEFYIDFVRMCTEEVATTTKSKSSNPPLMLTLYGSSDAHQLEMIVGTDRAASMLASKQALHVLA